MAHFFPELSVWLKQTQDRRDPDLITYSRQFLLWMGLMAFLLKLGSRRQVRFELDSPAALANLNRLARTEQEAMAHSDTLNDFLGGVPPASLARLRRQMAYYGAWLRDTACERGLGFVDMWGPLNDISFRERQKDRKFTMIRDSVHPDAPAQVIMAVAIVDNLNLPRVVSAASLKLRDGKWSGSGTSAEVTEVVGTANSVTFTSIENALPWVLPAEAQPGVTLTKLGAAFSRETIQVSGLPAGEYSVQIDGQEVVKATADQLAAGLDLQSNSKTPQYQQAAKVAELNKKRNEGPVKRLRNEWVNFQNVKFLAAQVAKNPGDEAEKKRLADAEKRMPGMDDRVKAANSDAQKMEDEIFQANQPKPHKFAIQPATNQ